MYCEVHAKQAAQAGQGADMEATPVYRYESQSRGRYGSHPSIQVSESIKGQIWKPPQCTRMRANQGADMEATPVYR